MTWGGIVGARRVGLVVVTSAARAVVVFLVAVSTIYFLVEAAWPGDGAERLCGVDCTPEQVDVLRAERGLDNDSVIAGYGRWLGDLASLDLGRSMMNQDVAESLRARWEPTIEVAVTAELAAVGLVLAGASLTRRLRATRRSAGVATTLAALAWSVPSYAVAVVLLREVSFRREWLPATSWTFVGDGLADHLRHAAIPFLAVLVPSVGFWAWLVLRDRSRGIRADIAIVARAFPAVLPWAFSAAMVIEGQVASAGLGNLFLLSVPQGDEATLRGVLALLAAVACAAGFLGLILAGLLESSTRPSATIGGAVADGLDGEEPGEVAPVVRPGTRDPRRWAWTPLRAGAMAFLALLLGGAVVAGWQPSYMPTRVLADPEGASPKVVEELRMVVQGAHRVVRIALPVGAAVTVLAMALASSRRLRSRGPDLVVHTLVTGLGMVPALGLGLVAASIVREQLTSTTPWTEAAWVAATTVVPGYLWWRARLADHRPDVRGAAIVFLRVSAIAVFTLFVLEPYVGAWDGWGYALLFASNLTWEDDSYLWLAVLAITLTCFSLRVLADWLDSGPNTTGVATGLESSEAGLDAEQSITVFGEDAPAGAR